MTGTEFLTFVLLAFTVGRLTRFVCMDTLWEEWRERLIAHFEERTPKGRSRDFLARKISELLTCPWCVSIWLSAIVLVVSRQAEIHFGWGIESLPLPVWQWLGLSMFAVMFIEWTDGERQVAVRQNPERGH